MSQPDATTPAIPKGRRRSRWLCALLLLATIAGLFWWRVTRLNELEQQFVGQWTTTERYDDGYSCTRNWQLRKDRSLHFSNLDLWVAAPGRPARNEKREGVMSWSIREGRLLLHPNHPTPKRLEVLWKLTRWRAQNSIQGVSEIVMDHEGSNGRLSAVGPQTFTVNWWNPEKKSESTRVVYTRVATGQQPSASE